MSDTQDTRTNAFMLFGLIGLLIIIVLVGAAWVALGMFTWSHTDSYRWAWMSLYGAVTTWLVGCVLYVLWPS
jgi:hypothetical protein